ncbi:MAG: hypothetical protein ACTSU0_00485 [Alphaproteobacteria bacterium]
MIARHVLVVLAAAAMLGGCATTGGRQSSAEANAAAHMLNNGLAEAIGRCWFAAPETAFEAYIYTPEIVGGRPRILLAPKETPGGRPVLVIEPRSAAAVEIYGPLTTSALGPRITADIDRWRAGGTACGS